MNDDTVSRMRTLAFILSLYDSQCVWSSEEHAELNHTTVGSVCANDESIVVVSNPGHLSVNQEIHHHHPSAHTRELDGGLFVEFTMTPEELGLHAEEIKDLHSKAFHGCERAFRGLEEKTEKTLLAQVCWADLVFHSEFPGSTMQATAFIKDRDRYLDALIQHNAPCEFLHVLKCFIGHCLYTRASLGHPSLDTVVALYHDFIGRYSNRDMYVRYGDLFMRENSVESRRMALEWYAKAQAEEHPVACNKLGMLYESEGGDPHAVFHLYERSAKGGYAPGQYNFARVCEARNMREAFDWYKEAAHRMFPLALNRLGLIYEKGSFDTTQDLDKALDYYTRSADKKCKEAQNNLGMLYEKGIGVARDLTKAIFFYEEAAAQGESDSDYYLGTLYEKYHRGTIELPVSKIGALTKAKEYYVRAVDGGNVKACYKLGVFYEKGEAGLIRNLDEARRLYKIAADHAHPNALFSLGKMYERGSGVPVDIEIAKHYYNEAVTKGHQNAKERFRVLNNE